MRFAFGLVGLLVAIGVITMIMSKRLTYDKAAIDAGKQATAQVQQVAGRDEDGKDVRRSFTADADDSSKMNGVIITSIEAGSALEKFYGLKRGDTVVEIQSRAVKEMGSPAEAKDFIADSYARQQPL